MDNIKDLYKQSPLTTIVVVDENNIIKLPVLQFGVPNINGRIYTAEAYKGFNKGAPDEESFSGGIPTTLLNAEIEGDYLIATAYVNSPSATLLLSGLRCYPAARSEGGLSRDNYAKNFTLLGFDLIPVMD
jgi:hypothetical protein